MSANVPHATARAAALALALVGAGWVLPSGARGHEIPTDVTVHLFVKPEGDRLRVLVRVPLEAMRDMDFPLIDDTYLDLEEAGPELRNAAILWIADEMRFFQDGRPLAPPTVVAARASIPTDRSFRDFDTALAHVLDPTPPGEAWLVWTQALLDVAMEVPITDEAAAFALRPGVERLGVRVETVIRFLPPGGAERAFRVSGDPGVVELDPRWHQAAFSFVSLGFEHILGGIDHLLFLLCLVIPFRRLKALVLIVTAFTLAHSITLVASALGMAPGALWFPPLVETLIAASIVYMALENIVGASLSRRGAITFGFGLIHGFGFSFALQETMQFAGRHLLVSLLAFNVGVELGQLLVLLILVPALGVLLGRMVPERLGVIVLSALVAHTGWHWMADRWDVLRAFGVGWGEVGAAVMASGLRWMLAALILAALAWIAMRRVRWVGGGGVALPAEE